MDIYSFGILLWEILVQKMPFEGVPSYDIPKLVLQLRRHHQENTHTHTHTNYTHRFYVAIN